MNVHTAFKRTLPLSETKIYISFGRDNKGLKVCIFGCDQAGFDAMAEFFLLYAYFVIGTSASMPKDQDFFAISLVLYRNEVLGHLVILSYIYVRGVDGKFSQLYKTRFEAQPRYFKLRKE